MRGDGLLGSATTVGVAATLAATAGLAATVWIAAGPGVALGGTARDAGAASVADRHLPPTRLTVETLITDLDTPWDLGWGPDGAIWVTERGGRISRVDPATGRITRAGELEVLERGESGLMGMAFHPDFEREPYVYLAHSYAADRGVRNRLVRMRWDGARLGAPQRLLDAIPGNWNHDGARLAFGPDGFLYVTTGDAGRPALAQDRSSLAGKVLRMTPAGEPAPGNAFGLLYSYGHRNAQGIVFHPESGDLYVSEHGPGDNDEVSRVIAGGDHGWPAVRGFCDGDAPDEDTYCRDHEVVQPLAAWTPTVGLSGIEFYASDRIPGWRGSLLVTSLRGATLYRLELAADGRSVVGRQPLFEREFGRLRDVLVGPEGEVYLATSNRDGRGRPASDDDRILRITP